MVFCLRPIMLSNFVRKCQSLVILYFMLFWAEAGLLLLSLCAVKEVSVPNLRAKIFGKALFWEGSMSFYFCFWGQTLVLLFFCAFVAEGRSTASFLMHKFLFKSCSAADDFCDLLRNRCLSCSVVY
jgi:hypothetical protein